MRPTWHPTGVTRSPSPQVPASATEDPTDATPDNVVTDGAASAPKKTTAKPRATTAKPNKKRASSPVMRRILTFAPPLLLLAGIAVLLYPVIATQYNNQRQADIAAGFTSEIINADVAETEQQLTRADHYNLGVTNSPILDPWLEEQRPDTPQYQAYLSQLNMHDVMAIIKIPSINITLPIYHGTEDSTLDKGVGHLFGTALPVGGTSTHTVLTAHSGLGNSTMFDHLPRLTEGDVFYLETMGRTMKYQVNDIRVVLPNETSTLNKEEGRDLATLITCTPYGINTHRLLVTGERVPMDEESAQAEAATVTAHNSMEWWMIAILIGVAAVIVLSVWLWVGAKRRRKGKTS